MFLLFDFFSKFLWSISSRLVVLLTHIYIYYLVWSFGNRLGKGLTDFFFAKMIYFLYFQVVESILTNKPGGDRIMKEYHQTKSLTDESRKGLLNMLAADLTEKYG